MYELRDIPADAPEARPGKDDEPRYTAAIYRPDGSYCFRFRPEALKTLGSGRSFAEEILDRLNGR